MRFRALLVAVLAVSLLTLPATAKPLVQTAAEPTDPTGVIASDNVTLLGTIPEPSVVGARFRDGIMYVSALTGLTTYDISDPAAPVRLGRLALPHFENEDVDLGGDILLISNDASESTGILYVIDISDPANPAILSQLAMGGSPLGGPGHTASCVDECRFAWVTDGGGIKVIDLRDPAAPKDLGTHEAASGGLVVHDVQLDGDGLYWIAGFNGTAAYRIPAGYDGSTLGELVVTTNALGRSRYAETFGVDDGSTYNDFIHHNSLRREGSDTVYITEEDYNRPGCRGAGSFQRWHLPLDSKTGQPTGEELTPIDQWSPELAQEGPKGSGMCSAHYFDENRKLVAQGWYQQGLRLLDVKGKETRQVGYYITPDVMAWAAYFPPTDKTGEIVYVLNASRGIDVIHVDRSKKHKDMPTVTAPILPQWRTSTSAPDPVFGFACLLR